MSSTWGRRGYLYAPHIQMYCVETCKPDYLVQGGIFWGRFIMSNVRLSLGYLGQNATCHPIKYTPQTSSEMRCNSWTQIIWDAGPQ
jgi:hypothetical protein